VREIKVVIGIKHFFLENQIFLNFKIDAKYLKKIIQIFSKIPKNKLINV
jgi:hypothetical protein